MHSDEVEVRVLGDKGRLQRLDVTPYLVEHCRDHCGGSERLQAVTVLCWLSSWGCFDRGRRVSTGSFSTTTVIRFVPSAIRETKPDR